MPGNTGYMDGVAAYSLDEITTEVLEAYRHANSAVYDLLERTEDRYLDARVRGLNPWDTNLGVQAESLCTWNAFALQTLGDRFLEAARETHSSTTSTISRQTLLFYTQVERWLSRESQARSNPDYRFDVSLPASFPLWLEADSCSRERLDAMLACACSLRTHAQASLAMLEEAETPPEKRAAHNRLHQIMARATSAADYAERLCSGAIPAQMHEQIERYLKRAIEEYYTLGQMIAMPAIVDPNASLPSEPMPVSSGRFRRSAQSSARNREPAISATYPPTIRYAGFWGRCVAFTLDWITCLALASLVNGALGAGSFVLTVLIAWLYFSGFESSRLQATPGKMLLGYKVTDLSGDRITFLHATGRFFAKYLSMLSMFVGFLLAALTARKQALHDLIARTLVLDSRGGESF